jgi:NSS family neurotransmitter:Na+ symporter
MGRIQALIRSLPASRKEKNQMSEKRVSIHGQWSSRWAFILAATGSAVGLGNVWKFPYITGENGGGAFVLVYLFCIALIGIPILMGEVLIGRRGRQSPAGSVAAVAVDSGASRFWGSVGWLGLTAGFFVLSFYAVIAGWALDYVFVTAKGSFSGASPEAVGEIFAALTSNPWQLILWQSLIIAMTLVVVAMGVRKGLEKAVSILMPGMFVLLLIMVAYAMTTGGFLQAVEFLFKPDFSKLTANGVLIAMGHAFFTLSLASGVMIMYGAYLPDSASIAKTSIAVAFADTLVALLAGLAIFPIVFANGIEPGSGPGLIFVSLPIAFGKMPFGTLIGTMFFVMLVFAALTTTISLIEAVVAYLVENRGLSRFRSALIAGFSVWFVGLGTVLSFGAWKDLTFNSLTGLNWKFELFDRHFYDALDFLVTNLMLPMGGFLVAIFCAWIMRDQDTSEELGMAESSLLYMGWHWTMRVIAPILIIIVFLNALGIDVLSTVGLSNGQ